MGKIDDLRQDYAKMRNLPERVRALEAAVQENRALSRRVAELLDVVTELLLPVADRDEARVHEVLEQYRDGSFQRGG